MTYHGFSSDLSSSVKSGNQVIYGKEYKSRQTSILFPMPVATPSCSRLRYARTDVLEMVVDSWFYVIQQHERLLMGPSMKDCGGGRAASFNIIPSCTAAAKMGKEEDAAAAEAVGRSGVVVAVKPNPNKGIFTSKVISLLESAAVKLMHKNNDLKPVGSLPTGNFAPVNETPKPLTNLVLKGNLPECLDGEFLMVGPNFKFAPVAGYNWSDGDGMVHGIRIKQGNAVAFVSRYVRTSRFKQEEFHGAPVFVKAGDLKGMFGLVMLRLSTLRRMFQVIDTSYCSGTANAALEYHAGRLLVLGSRSTPYAIKVLENGDLQTVGIVVSENGLDYSFNPHPKIDPVTGEMFAFCLAFGSPYLIFRVISKDGVMRVSVPVTLSTTNIIVHDFAITESYAIFIDHPCSIDPKNLLKGKKSICSVDPTKKARFGILPRYARDEKLIKWFELPKCLIFHTANAWEEGNEVVLICCRTHASQGSLFSELYEMRFNMINGLAFKKRLSASYIRCPKINKSYTGRKQRYVYGMKCSDALSRRTKQCGDVFSGIVKFDLEVEPETENTKFGAGKNVKGMFEMGPGIFGSDAVFVPRRKGMSEMGRQIFGFEAIFAGRPESGTVEEDDGYLIFFAHDENKWKSSVMVIDAKTMSPDPVATIELPTRVPYGSKAFFMSEDQLREHAECS